MKLSKKQILAIVIALVVLVGAVWFGVPRYVPHAVSKDDKIGDGVVTINSMQDVKNKEKVSVSFKKMESTRPVYIYVDGKYVKKIGLDDSNEKTTVTLGAGEVSDVGSHELKCVQYRTWYPSSQIIFKRTLEYSIH